MNIWWIRRDLRLHDNQALTAALSEDSAVLPLFILDVNILDRSNPRRNEFLFENLKNLDTSLRERGSRLILRKGKPLPILQQVMQESGAVAIFAEQDYSYYAKLRDKQISEYLPLILLPGLTIQPLSAVKKADGKPYTIFTPYSRQWKKVIQPFKEFPTPDQFGAIPQIVSKPIPSSHTHPLFAAGEEAAQKRLTDFLQNQITSYGSRRDFAAEESTSLLSPYFHFGVLSIRSAYQRAFQLQNNVSLPEEKKGIETWINELLWREFFIMILSEFPHVVQGPFRKAYERIPWRSSKEDIESWKTGKTGYPFVDAGMRQLLETGWMHNRARMVVASFLCKDLLINWQWGEAWFNEQLLDGDLAANNGGWQWCAGCGTDAAPYFRVFNPITQSKKFDPDGEYIRAWVPELTNVPDRYIHTPWKMPYDLQRDSKCIIGKNYPDRIVEHAFARQRALDAYSVIKN